MLDGRSYALLTVKAVDEERRTFSGTATTPTPDLVGDIVDPLGVSFKNPLPLLLNHDVERPVGHAQFHPPTAKGIDFTATIPVVTESGVVKTRVDEAWHSVKSRLITGVSIRIGAKSAADVKRLSGGGIHWLKSFVSELSLVTIPMNAEATIASIKSLDAAALGRTTDTVNHPAGDSALSRVTTRRTPTMPTPVADQIKSFEATRQAHTARMTELMQKASDEGRTLDEAEGEEYDGLETKNKGIDEHLTRLRAFEAQSVAAAVPVAGTTPQDASKSRAGGSVIRVVDQLPPGIRFARYAMCLASAKGFPNVALEIAKARYPEETAIHDVLKAAVAAGTTTDTNWATALVQYQDFAGDFIEYLRPRTIIDRFGRDGVPSLNRVPFNIRVASQTTGGSGYWVAEGKPKPLTKFHFTTVTLQWNKVANIAVLTEEEVRHSTPSAEAKVRDALAAALIERLDIDFVDPTKAAVANTSPASITYGLAAVPASNTTAAALRVDFGTAMQKFITANITPSSLVIIMSATTALQISLMRNALGQSEFPELTMTGGSLFGVPVLVSEHLKTLGSPGTNIIVFVNASDVYLADDGQVVIDASREASLEMLDGSLTQDATAGTGASLVSLWQGNLLGLRAERVITWKLRRAAGAAYISNAAYVAS